MVKNIRPATPVVLERVVMPNALAFRKNKLVIASERTIAVNEPLQPDKTVDVGSIEEVHDGGADPGGSVADLRALGRPPGVGSCSNTGTMARVYLRYGTVVQEALHDVRVTWCPEGMRP